MDDLSARAPPGAAAGGARTPGEPLDLDGRLGQGGGQVLRAALALSLCTGRPFSLRGLRADRAAPGLTRELLACVQAAVAVSGGTAEGAVAGATDVAFTPGEVRAGEHTFGVGSAANCLPLLQMLWPALGALADASRVVLRGATHSPDAPPFQFLWRAQAPLMARLGWPAALHLRRHGFQPTGGGSVEASFGGDAAASAAGRPFDVLDRGALLEGYAECLIAAVPRHVAARELDTLGRSLGWAGEQLRLPLVRQNEGPGNALLATLVHAHVTEVFTGIGEKGVSAETVARQVARAVRDHLAGSAALGPHLAEHWLLPLAVAVSRSGTAAGFTCSAATPHLQAQAALAMRFLPVGVDVAADGAGWRVHVAPAP